MSSPPSSSAKPQSRSSGTHERILDTAAKLFAENGYTRTTTGALAAAAGITEMTLFRHFGSKENLFAAVVERYGGRAIAADLEAELTGDYRADLIHIGHLFLNIVMERGKIMQLMMVEARHFPELAQTLSQNPRLLRQMLARYLQQQIDLGHVRPLDVEAAAQAFCGMLFAYGLSADVYNEPHTRMPPEEIVAHFVDIFINGTLRQE